MRLVPADGSLDVDADLTALEVRFDRDMDRSRHAFCGGGPAFPAISRVEWVDARTLRANVDLRPDAVYLVELSCAGSSGFRDAKGNRLEPVLWRFCTKDESPAPPEVALARNQKAFARLGEAVHDYYSYRDRLGVDWSERFEAHRESMLGAPSKAALALIAADILSAAQDPHVSVVYGRTAVPTTRRRVIPNCNPALLPSLLAGYEALGKKTFRARTEDGIGYVRIDSFRAEDRAEIDAVLDALRGMRDAKGIVIDVRLNSGGDETLARSIAALFVEGRRVYAAHTTRNPRSPGGFDERRDREIEGAADRFEGPVAVLTGPVVMSSAEAFLLMMKQASKARLVGAPSYGSSGNPIPHSIAGGLVVMLPSWRALRPDGTCFEGTGILPDIPVEAADFSSRDRVLESALSYLRGL
ncbi:MAG: hypothetical protein Fur0037_03200 [Planctomycetota bacterium]